MRLAALALLAACGGSPPVAATPATTPSPAPTAAVAPAAEPPVAPTTAPPPDTAVCDQRADQFGPFELTAAQVADRYGAQAKTFADAPTTKDRAIEVCGVVASQQWLLGTTCADGSRAFANGAAARQSRRGNVGPGGRCGAIIDLYVASCPEATYEVHIDMYMCGPGESLM